MLVLAWLPLPRECSLCFGVNLVPGESSFFLPSDGEKGTSNTQTSSYGHNQAQGIAIGYHVLGDPPCQATFALGVSSEYGLLMIAHEAAVGRELKPLSFGISRALEDKGLHLHLSHMLGQRQHIKKSVPLCFLLISSKTLEIQSLSFPS